MQAATTEAIFSDLHEELTFELSDVAFCGIFESCCQDGICLLRVALRDACVPSIAISTPEGQPHAPL